MVVIISRHKYITNSKEKQEWNPALQDEIQACLDEIFSLWLQMKLNPPLQSRWSRISSHAHTACGILRNSACRPPSSKRDCDSRRELRALVVRRENSSTGRVFYTAPTSNPVAHTMQKHPDKSRGAFTWCGWRDLNPHVSQHWNLMVTTPLCKAILSPHGCRLRGLKWL